MTRVMASGVFDILHTGHISYLEQAKAMGDELFVVVACDDTVRKRKHEPITPDYMRVQIISSLKSVDTAIVGTTGDMMETVRNIKPDIIVLGFDQHFKEEDLQKQLAEAGFDNIKVTRANECAEDLNATRRIVQRIRELGGCN